MESLALQSPGCSIVRADAQPTRPSRQQQARAGVEQHLVDVGGDLDSRLPRAPTVTGPGDSANVHVSVYLAVRVGRQRAHVRRTSPRGVPRRTTWGVIESLHRLQVLAFEGVQVRLGRPHQHLLAGTHYAVCLQPVKRRQAAPFPIASRPPRLGAVEQSPPARLAPGKRGDLASVQCRTPLVAHLV